MAAAASHARAIVQTYVKVEEGRVGFVSAILEGDCSQIPPRSGMRAGRALTKTDPDNERPMYQVQDNNGDGTPDLEFSPCDPIVGNAIFSSISTEAIGLFEAAKRFAARASSMASTEGLSCRNADDWAMVCEGKGRTLLITHKDSPEGFEMPDFMSRAIDAANGDVIIAVDTDGDGRPDIASAIFRDPTYGTVFVDGAAVAVAGAAAPTAPQEDR